MPIFLGEELTADMIIGSILVVCAVVLSKFGAKQAQEGFARDITRSMYCALYYVCAPLRNHGSG
jgi:hypothetical protein